VQVQCARIAVWQQCWMQPQSGNGGSLDVSVARSRFIGLFCAAVYTDALSQCCISTGLLHVQNPVEWSLLHCCMLSMGRQASSSC
jgi:hypothetical protein